MSNQKTFVSRPPSQIPPLTGIVGLVVFLTTVFAFHSDPFLWRSDSYAVLSLGVTTFFMFAVEAFIRWRGFVSSADLTFYALTRQRLYHALNFGLVIKLYGLAIIFLTAALFYALFSFYSGKGFILVFKWASDLAPYFLGFGILYIWVTHAVQKQPCDSLWHFGRFFLPLGDRHLVDRERVREQALSWGIKIFFLPLMASFFFDWWGNIAAYDIFFRHTDLLFKTVFDFLFNFLYLIDTAFAVIGYVSTFQLLNTHIRYPEVKLTGWVVTLALYNPFNQILFQQLAYNDGLEWGEYFWGSPFLYAMHCLLILGALGVYTCSTVFLGLRFSNLTYRGITTSGPYAFTKHPAYWSKCLSWWLIELPFIAVSPWLAFKNSVMLSLICGLYALRARYEEQMLARLDPLYVDYQNYIRTTGGVWPRARRLYHRHIAPLFQMLDR